MQLIRPFEKAWPMTQNFATKVTYMRSGIHSGIDWACPSGTDLFAVFDGEIIQRDDFTLTGYGRAIYLRSLEDPRFVALYGHCSKLIAPVGAKVKAASLVLVVVEEELVPLVAVVVTVVTVLSLLLLGKRCPTQTDIHTGKR